MFSCCEPLIGLCAAATVAASGAADEPFYRASGSPC